MGYDAVDLFAGPGGWDQGASMVGLSTVGLRGQAATTHHAANPTTRRRHRHPAPPDAPTD